MQADMRKPIRPLFIALLCLLALAGTWLAPHPAQAQVGGEIRVEKNKSRIVRLPLPAAVVAVADPEIANVDVMAPDMIALRGSRVGQTSVVAFDADGNEILNDTVHVVHNTATLARILRTLLPESEVKFDSVDGALVATGTVATPLEAEQVRQLVEPMLGEDSFVNMLNIRGSDQVLLKVRIAEVSRTELKRFGINLYSLISTGGQFAFGLVTGRDIQPGSSGTISRGDGNNNIGINFRSGDVDVNSVIDALADDNVIKVLAEPNLTTTSGKTANFLAGGEFPIPVPGENGQVTIEYREYGVALQFTPQVLSKEKISLTVAPEVSELSQLGAVEFQGFSIPALTTRRAETTVELGSGQSFAIAGLLQNGNSSTVSKFPGLGDLPILGALFRSTEFQNDESELVILVTPYIVRGVDAKELTDPTVGYTPPNEVERIIEGRHYSPEPAPQDETGVTDYKLGASPADLRDPRYRRKMAQQARENARHPAPNAPHGVMTPAPPAAKYVPVEEKPLSPPAQVAPAQVTPKRELHSPAAPTPRPAAPARKPATVPQPAAKPAPPQADNSGVMLNGSVGYRLQ